MPTYDPETGWLTRYGRRAGTAHHTGYRQIRIGGGKIAEHRLIWKIMTGEWPDGDIDHINRDRSDNRWSNLRLATRSQNMANMSGRSSTGFKGVYRNKGKFYATITHNYKRIYIGRFDTAEEAHNARVERGKAIFGERYHL